MFVVKFSALVGLASSYTMLPHQPSRHWKLRLYSDKDFYTELPTKEDEEALIAAVEKKWLEIDAARGGWEEVTEEERLDDRSLDVSVIPEEIRAAARLLPEDEQLRFLNRAMIDHIVEAKRAELREWKIQFDKELAESMEETKQKIFQDVRASKQAYYEELDQSFVDTGLVTADELAAAIATIGDNTTVVTKVRFPPEPEAPVVVEWPPAKDAKIAVVVSGDGTTIPPDLIQKEMENLGYRNVEILQGGLSKILGKSDKDKATCAIVIHDAKLTMAKAAVDAVVTTRLQEGGCLVLASLQGATRAGNLDVAMKNFKTGGAYSRAADTEAAAKLAVNRQEDKVLSYIILRLGDIVAPGTKPLTVVPGNDDPDVGPVSPAVAAKALAKIVVEPAALNSTFALSGTTDGTPATIWQDQFLKLTGPELLRLETTSTVVPLSDLQRWLADWANVFLDQQASGLTTPVDVVPTSCGATLSFVSPKYAKARRKPKEGGVDLLAEPSPSSSSSSSSSEGDTLRVRAVRTSYDSGIAVKAMSEDVILSKLQRDFTSQFG